MFYVSSRPNPPHSYPDIELRLQVAPDDDEIDLVAVDTDGMVRYILSFAQGKATRSYSSVPETLGLIVDKDGRILIEK